MFGVIYLIGMSIGLGFFALTYLFSKTLKTWYRSLVVFIIGVLFLLGSIIIVGGFEGMGYGVISLGILSIAVLLLIFPTSLLWKKSIYTVVILAILSNVAFGYLNKLNYWVVKKSDYSYVNSVDSYIKKIQNEPSIQGYKIFTILEGNQGVVLSLGEKMFGNNIEVLDVEESGNTTHIKIRTFQNKSIEKNPVIVIGVERLQPEILITDTDGTIYNKAD